MVTLILEKPESILDTAKLSTAWAWVYWLFFIWRGRGYFETLTFGFRADLVLYICFSWFGYASDTKCCKPMRPFGIVDLFFLIFIGEWVQNVSLMLLIFLFRATYHAKITHTTSCDSIGKFMLTSLQPLLRAIK